MSVNQSGVAFSCTPPPNPPGFGALTCTTATLAAAAASTTFTMTAFLAPFSHPGAGPLFHFASVSSATTSDPNGANNNTGSIPATVVLVTNESASKTGPAFLVPGTPATYTITTTNSGPSTLFYGQLVDVLPAPLRFVSVTKPTNYNCTTPAV